MANIRVHRQQVLRVLSVGLTLNTNIRVINEQYTYILADHNNGCGSANCHAVCFVAADTGDKDIRS